jgi:hypothetical protein
MLNLLRNEKITWNFNWVISLEFTPFYETDKEKFHGNSLELPWNFSKEQFHGNSLELPWKNSR